MMEKKIEGKQRFRIIRGLLVLLVSGLMMVSCASSRGAGSPEGTMPGMKTPEQLMGNGESQRQVREMNERLLLGLMASKDTSSQDYRIGPDDLLEISVFEDEKLNKTVRVSSQGNVSLPLIGILRVKGLTGPEAEKEVRELLTEKYLYDPHVAVFIKEYHNQRISMMGAVVKPGVYDVTGHKTVLDLLSISGGLRDDAGRILFLIRNPGGEGGKSKPGMGEGVAQAFSADLDQLLIKGDLNLNFSLMHGDVINVPPAGKVFVGGAVKAPGGFALTRNMTVSQAIAMAGGLKYQAKGDETRVFRFTGKGAEKEMVMVNVYGVQDGQTVDPYLKENDTVFVPQSASKATLYEFWDFLKGHITPIPVW